jgi:hypothetical protein
MMHKRFIVLLGMFLSSHVLAVAQTPIPQIVLAQDRIAPIMPMLRKVSTPLPAASFLLLPGQRKSPVRFGHLFAGPYERDHSLERLPRVEEFKTLFFTQSSLPLVLLWGGRLQLDAFHSTLHTQNVQLGPSAAGGLQDFRPPRQSFPAGPRSVDLSGFSLSFYFGGDARAGGPTPARRCLSRIIGTALN